MLRKNYGYVRVDFAQPFSLKVRVCGIPDLKLVPQFLLTAEDENTVYTLL